MPEANPVKARFSRSLICPFMKNTQAEPSTVPKNGIKIPCITLLFIILPSSFFCLLQNYIFLTCIYLILYLSA